MKPSHLLALNSKQLDTEWPTAYIWAIEHMPGAAYCCSQTGALVHCNQAAVRLWGCTSLINDGIWDGFQVLQNLDGRSIDKNDSPAARAVSKGTAASVELLAISADGQQRRVVIHTKPVFDSFNNVVGVLCSVTDISDKHNLRQRLDKSANTRHDFLRMLAHELRNPLAPIMSIASLLKRPDVDPKFEKIGTIVERQTTQLARFITDLLDASRIDCVHQLPIKPRLCTEKELLELTLDIVEPVTKVRSQDLKVNTATADLQFCCDVERVAQALSCVLLNASAYSSDGKEFHLRITVKNAELSFEVIDFGTGIAAEDLAHVFEPFVKRAIPPGRVSEGAGLGLTIAKGVCEAHGGSINVSSAGLGEGTTVSMTIPIADNPLC